MRVAATQLLYQGPLVIHPKVGKINTRRVAHVDSGRATNGRNMMNKSGTSFLVGLLLALAFEFL